MEFFKVISPDEAKKIITVSWQYQLKTVKKKITECLGMILATDIISGENVPNFTKSTVDGYAVKASDTFGASDSLPAYLQLTGQVEMGKEFTDKLQGGQAVKVPTGGMLPKGADAVVMIEQAEEINENLVAVMKSVAPRENVIVAGEDVAEKTVILSKGRRIKAVDLGLLAAVGQVEVEVQEPVKVGIISTGDEIVNPAIPVELGQIKDINSYTLAGFIKEAGGIPTLYGIIPDQYHLLKETIEKSVAENHITLVSGGSSVGTRDFTGKILSELGEPGLLFHGVSIKPGKPTLAAVAEDKLIFGLPGHPASALTSFRLLVEELISWGHYVNDPLLEAKNQIKAKLIKGVASTAGRKDYIPVTITKNDDGWLANPVLGKSGLILPLIKSDGYLVIPLHSGGLELGETVTITLW